MFKYTPIYSGGNAPQMIEEDVFKMIVPLSFEEEGVVQKTTQKNQIRLGEVLGERLDEKLGKNQLQIINLMRNKPAISIVKIAEKLGISDTAVENNIKKLKTLGIIKRIGPDKGGHWKIAEMNIAKTVEETQNKLGEILGEGLGEELGENQLQIINLMRNKPAISIVKIAEKLGISDTAVENNIKKLKTLEIIKRIGPNKGGHWEVVKGKP